MDDEIPEAPVVRRLETGEKVTHYPDGRMVRLGNTNVMGGALAARQEEFDAQSQVLTEALLQAATDKRESLASGDPVPDSKRSV